MFYTFSQNRADEHYVTDPERGIGVHVVIEAKNAAAANVRAEQIGLELGPDLDGCGRCGHRWGAVIDTEGAQTPTGPGLPDGFVHYADGTFRPLRVGSWA